MTRRAPRVRFTLADRLGAAMLVGGIVAGYSAAATELDTPGGIVLLAGIGGGLLVGLLVEGRRRG